jgi:hypothetical protein
LALRRRRLTARLALADANAVIHDRGAEAYHEARRRERDVVLLRIPRMLSTRSTGS